MLVVVCVYVCACVRVQDVRERAPVPVWPYVCRYKEVHFFFFCAVSGFVVVHTRVAVKLKRKNNKKMQAAFFFVSLAVRKQNSTETSHFVQWLFIKPPFSFPWREHIIIFVVFTFLSLNAKLSVVCFFF